MTLQHALGALDEVSDYSVSLADRIGELFLPDEMLGSDVELTYSWSGGYEKVTIRRAGGGGYEYGGSYHPEGYCSTGTDSDTGTCGTCVRCGRSLM